MPFSHFVGISWIVGVIGECAGPRYGFRLALLLCLALILGFALVHRWPRLDCGTRRFSCRGREQRIEQTQPLGVGLGRRGAPLIPSTVHKSKRSVHAISSKLMSRRQLALPQVTVTEPHADSCAGRF